jgi:glycosyltransferase involved in cell wall biosynthesis
VATLRQRHPGVRLLLVGEPSFGENLHAEGIKRLANDLGLGDTVVFTGFRRDVPDVMAAMDIFAFPSHAEAFGMVLIEAMATELPVVSTNCDGVLDIVVDGETGIYVPPRNPLRFAAALERLMGDGALRRSMGTAGRKRAVALFEWQDHLQRLESVYTELLAPGPATPPC